MDGGRQRIRRYLFLQGTATPFFARLGAALAVRGHDVRRINFTAGDRLFWTLPGSTAYRGTLDRWPRFLEARLDEWRTTDIVLFGDWRPLHAAAIRVASVRGLLVHVFEEGYVRPNWVTIEEGGVNGNSALPRDPNWFLREAASLPPWAAVAPVAGSFRNRAVQDVLYHVWSALFAWRYPGYRSHLPLHPLLEYAGWIRRFARTPSLRRRAAETVATLERGGMPYYLLPLQLDTDSQLRINSSFGRQAPALEAIVESYARHAPTDTLLVLKEHPLDPQLIDWGRLARRVAARRGVANRVRYLAGGNIDALIRRARGVVTINSTCGFLALSFGRPLVALANPIYDLPGLAFQGGLDRFWRDAPPPNPALFDAFRRVVVHRTQVHGDFFSAEGIALAISGSVKRLEAHTLNDPLATISRVAVTLPSASAVMAARGN
jgi:capsular polysaccharide export protein